MDLADQFYFELAFSFDEPVQLVERADRLE